MTCDFERSLGVVAAPGGVPDELADERCGLGPGRVKLAPDRASGGVGAEEVHLSEALPCLGQQRGGGCLVVPLVQLPDLVPDERDGDQVSAGRVAERKVQAAVPA
jgi:hypothetical protein